MTNQPRPLDQTDENHMNPTLKGLDQWPNVASLPPSSPVEAFSEPGRVETAEQAFNLWWTDQKNSYVGSLDQAWKAFMAGWGFGRLR